MTTTSRSLHVLIIGGYGEFGGRLAQLLMRDGHHLIVAGRNLNKATQFCHQHGGTPVKLDINSDLTLIGTLKPDVVVDAAGPFQHYNNLDNCYRVAKQALECGAHYLDLSDDGEFSRGIVRLDAEAKNKNLFALSGASSTPAISGAAVSYCLTKLDSIEKIETSILPGCRAPQGQSVMLAILDQVGNPIPIWRNGTWVNCTGWSNPVIKELSGSRRQANLITAADVALFPDYFKANTVLFRAGLEIPLMHNSLQWLGALRAVGLLPNLIRLVTPLRWLADRITPFGSDNGGMLVEVIGNSRQSSTPVDGPLIQCCWTLSATNGQGPFVPAIPARALIRHIDSLKAGARACIDELPLDAYVQAMDDIEISTNFNYAEFKPIFNQALGEHWQSLPSAVRDSHRVIDQKILNGLAKITRGSSWIPRLIALIFHFPNAGDEVPVQVTKSRIGDKEIWVRSFNGEKFKSIIELFVSKRPATATAQIFETFGLLKFLLELKLDDASMHFTVVSASLFGIPIPKTWLPMSNSREYVKDDTMHFCVELIAPFKLGLIVRYEGWLK